MLSCSDGAIGRRLRFEALEHDVKLQKQTHLSATPISGPESSRRTSDGQNVCGIGSAGNKAISRHRLEVILSVLSKDLGRRGRGLVTCKTNPLYARNC